MALIDTSKLGTEITDKYSVENNSFVQVAKDNPLDKIDVEIGDTKQADFYPQVKVQRWDNEVNFSARLIHEETAPVVSTLSDKIVWEGDKVSVNFYDINNEEHPEGASEFEVILKEKPKTNVVSFTLNTKGLDFFYQPELTEKEITDGAVRPENVVGSYAVYAKTPKTNWTGGKEYKVGKVGHIYRPRIEDANGDWVWGDLHIENGILSVTIPQEFLDNAVYPVRHAAGLTIGYTTAGASFFGAVGDGQSGIKSYLRAQTATLGAGTWTLSSMSAALKRSKAGTSDLDLYGVMWNLDSGGAGVHAKVASCESLDVSVDGAGYKFYTINAANESLPADTYLMSIAGNGADLIDTIYVELAYDSGVTSEKYAESTAYTGSGGYATIKAIDPWSKATYTGNYIISIYATYTAGGGATAKPHLLSATGVGR